MTRQKLRVFLNPMAGSAARVRAAFAHDARIDLHELEPARVGDAVRAEVQRGTTRIAVCGGDGTLSTALGAAAGTSLEVGIIPGGTLNHFARDCGIPLDNPHAALDVALNGTPQHVDLGCVNGHPILNTSSVGVYVDFVRRREMLERKLRYRIASVGAAFAVWHDPHAFVVELRTAGGVVSQLTTPLVFLGVQERLLARGAPGTLGVRRRGGARALHVLVVNEHTKLRIRSLVFRAVLRGIDGLIGDAEIASYLTQRVTIASAEPGRAIAADGELLHPTWPLSYEFIPNAVKVMHPVSQPSIGGES